MKPEQGTETNGETDPAPLTGDVIGDTAYSERFVLKILLKFANLDTLKDEMKDQTFEEDLCTLWDMTAERDVVLFLKKHIALNLFTFALPTIDSNRIIEIIIGIIGNMCCQKEIADMLLKMDDLLALLVNYMRSDDSQILNQLLRLINSCLFLAAEGDIATWMGIFENMGYPELLYFILKNSSNKELLVTALENFNTICTYCNNETFRDKFFSMFVSCDAFDSLYIGYNEVIQNNLCEGDEQGRLCVVVLHITMHLVGFNKSLEMFSSKRYNIMVMLNEILTAYENKIVDQKQIDTDLVDVIESANTVISRLEMNEVSTPDKFFLPNYEIWRTVTSIANEKSDAQFDEEVRVKFKEFYIKLKIPLSLIMGVYMARCSDDNLLKVLDEIGPDYENILNEINDLELKESITKRAINYRNRLNENIDS